MEEKDVFAEFPKEGEVKDESTEEETKVEAPAESQPAKEEENVPFHKHPRWQQLQEEKEALAQREEALAQRVEELESKLVKTAEEVTTSLPDWWKSYYGDNDQSKNAYKEYQTQTKQVQDQVVDTVLNKIEERNQQREQERVQLEEDADRYIDNEIESLGKTEKFDKNELMKFMLDFEDKWGVPIVNSEGQYDFTKGLQMMNQYTQREEPSDEKKVISNLTGRTKSTRSLEKEDKTIPSHLLRRSGWIPPKD